MKRIVSMTLFSDPRTQGGIETFNRTMKNFYPENWMMITNSNRDSKIYDVADVTEIGSQNIFFKIINRMLKNKWRESLILKEVEKNLDGVIIFSFPHEVQLLKKIKAKKILVQHGNFDNYMSNYCGGRQDYINGIKNDTDYFIALSPQDGKRFKEELNLSENQIKVIRHSSKMKLLKIKKEKNKKLIIIARLDIYHKGLDMAIKVMKKLSDFTLEIYGDEHREGEKEKLEKIIKENNISNVFLRGSTNKVQEKLDESGIFIMTSNYEGYPISTIEAMRRGLPIILRNTFEAAEDIVIDNGVLLEKEWNEDKFVEAVKKVYANYEYYSENSKKLGERHSFEVIKKEWDKLLNN